MGKFGWKSGYAYPQNVQSGTVSITTDSNGDGTATTSFKRAFKKTPVVVLTRQAADATGIVSVQARSGTDFMAKVDASDSTGQAITVGYIAMDDTR